jgi:type IV secretory pathway VirB10-like protein
MGVQSLLGRREESGYTPAQWQAYDIRTAQTQARMAAQERDRSDRDDDSPAPAPVAPPAPEPTAPAPTAPVTQPPSVETAQADLTRAVDELTMPAGDRAARERAAGTPEMDLGSAAGAAAERAAAERTATSEAEREAADALLKGRRSTILTTPGGLLAPAEEQTTRTRSLIGGRSRA